MSSRALRHVGPCKFRPWGRWVVAATTLWGGAGCVTPEANGLATGTSGGLVTGGDETAATQDGGSSAGDTDPGSSSAADSGTTGDATAATTGTDGGSGGTDGGTTEGTGAAGSSGGEPSGGDTCDDNGMCEMGETPMSCPNDCMGGGGTCNNNGMCDLGETPMSCPNDCMGGGGTCNNNGTCDGSETEQSCPADCSWYLPDVVTPPEVDPTTIDPVLEAFPASDEAMCELPETCPGPISTFVDPWTGAHQDPQLQRSANEIVQVDARGQRAWTYFSLMGIEGDAEIVYDTVLADAMRVTLDGSTFPLESGTLNVHPARAAMWEYLEAAGATRITAAGYRGIDIDAGFYDTLCFDSDTVAGFGPWLEANLSAAELQEIEDQLTAEGVPGVTVDSNFNYVTHLTQDRGYATEAEFGGEGRLLYIDLQWDRYVHERVFAFMDTYLTGVEDAANTVAQTNFPVFLNRAQGDSIWTTAERYTVLGGETFINDGNILYPSVYRMAPYFRQGRIFGKRTWSWNFPRALDPSVADQVMDTVLVYIAENDAADGLLQIPDRSISYPLCPPEEPLCSATDAEMDALWAKIDPYLTYREAIRDTLHHDSQARALVVDLLGLSSGLWNNQAVTLDFVSLGVGAMLGDYQIDYDVTGWADGDYRHLLADTPWVTQPFLDAYDWIVLGDPQFLSANQVAMLNSYMSGGGHVIVLLYSDRTCVGGEQVACELKDGCRFDADLTSCSHAIDALTGVEGTSLFVVENVNAIDYRDDEASRAAMRTSFDTALAGQALPREMTSASDLTDLGVVHGRRSADGAHIWHLVNYSWDENTYASVPRSSATIDLAIPAELEGQTVNVTWFSAPDQRQELLSGVTLGSGGNVSLSVSVPAFDIWGTLVVTTGAHEPFAAARARPPYAKLSTYMPGAGGNTWQFEIEAVSSHASLDRAYLWGRAMVETSPGVWEASGDWHAVYEVDFTEGGTVDPGRKQAVTFGISRPTSVSRLEYYATACDADDLCQPFIPWAVLTRPPSP